MVRRREPIDDSDAVPPPLPPPAFEHESYRRSDGAMGTRFVMLPNGYDRSTPDVERTDYRGTEPWSEDVWQTIERCLGVNNGPDTAIRHDLREAVFRYMTGHAATRPSVRWSKVRDSLEKFEKAVQTLAGCLRPPTSGAEPRERLEIDAVRSMLTSSANAWKSDRRPESEADKHVAHIVDIAARLLPAAESDAPLLEADVPAHAADTVARTRSRRTHRMKAQAQTSSSSSATSPASSAGGRWNERSS
jgi:hypothetical protein